MLALKDYAASRNVSYEAVRKQVKRYQDELEGHVIRDNRTQYLDDEAVAFLDDRRNKNPIVVIQQDKDELLDQLRSEKEALLVKVAEQGARIGELADWKAENALLIAEAAQTAKLLEAANAELEEVRKKAAEADLLRTELEEAHKRRAEAELRERELKERGLLARIFRKGE